MTTEPTELRTYSRKHRPKGKIPCVAIGRPRITRTKVKPEFVPLVKEYRGWIPTSKGKEGLVYIWSSKLPETTEYEGKVFTLMGMKFNGDLVFMREGDL